MLILPIIQLDGNGLQVVEQMQLLISESLIQPFKALDLIKMESI